jgi:signal transduction histidine kinase
MEWLEAANRLETIAQQLSSVVHEVNNLLQIVSGSAEMLALTADAPASVLRRADVIGVQTQRAAALLGDVLALSREAPEVARIDLRETATRAMGLRRYAISKARIQERVDVCAEDAVVRADPRRLLQVVLNLVMRGERALASQPGAQLSVAVSCEGGRVVLAVEDNSRASSETSGDVTFESPAERAALLDSLGVGVQVASWLAAQEGGRLVLAPRAGGGTVAMLSLPAA